MLRAGQRERTEDELLLTARVVDLVDRAPRNLFFTGKGGVGKTSVACAVALALAARGRRVLLVSTDPASNLSEVLGTKLGPAAREVAGAPGLWALDVDPEAAARAWRERVVGPYRGVLPEAAVRVRSTRARREPSKRSRCAARPARGPRHDALPAPLARKSVHAAGSSSRRSVWPVGAVSKTTWS